MSHKSIVIPDTIQYHQPPTSLNNKKIKGCKGPFKVLRLCLLGIALPCLLIALPLYMRFKVYGNQLYPLAISDMRILDNKVSTTWCQRQLVRVNTTFNTFLLAQAPILSNDLKPISMVRHLVLEDDTKEYWGFYLLRGSSVTVSTCTRWPGASLIVIRGHKHLQECAYIGDNSSEELDEMMESIREGTYVAPNVEVVKTNKNLTSRPNAPNMMKRHRSDVEFRDPTQKSGSGGHTIETADDSLEDTDPITIQGILTVIQEKNKPPRRKNKQILSDDDFKDFNKIPWNKTIAEGEHKNLRIKAPVTGESLDDLSSDEVYSEIVRKLQGMGKKGERILEKLSNQTEIDDSDDDAPKMIRMKGRQYHKPVVQYEDNIDPNVVKRRRRRHLLLRTLLEEELNYDETETLNLAAEEGFIPDGIADHRGTFRDETSPNDNSNSEFWSSFSSSEEALLNCAGLILNLPLTPHHKCTSELSEAEAEETYLANSITYKVPSNGYYFFVFNSENEVQPNYIRVQFHLQKTVYNVSNPIANCSVTNNTCAMDLRFFSSEKLVMEIPLKENRSLWNEEFVVVSECEPRTAIYVACVVSVPILVLMFAFT